MWPLRLLMFPRLIGLGLATTCLVFVFIPVSTHFYFASDLASPEKIMNRKDTGVILLDRKGRPFFTFHNARNKKFVSLEDVPDYVQNAIIVMEDREFWSHKGVSVRSIARAALVNLMTGELRYGGSTITQQLAKNALLTPEKSFVRKYQEIILAREIEERYDKQKILEMYLNSVYFGRRGAFGIGEASRAYFRKDPQDLTIAEAAFLAAILPAPSYYAGNHEEAIKRQKLVLKEMYKGGYISSRAREEAEKQKLTLVPRDEVIVNRAPHFAFTVYEDLLKKYPEEEIERSGFKVRTTLDLDWQEYAETVVARHVATLARRHASNGAAVVMDPKTGEVRAMVGSRDWGNREFGKVNVATSLRQPGSSFKPIVYAAALERQLVTPATVLYDETTEYKTLQGSYRPENYDGRYRGPILARFALANSLNVPAVEVMDKVGVDEAIETAERFGISTLSERNRFGLALALGAGEVRLLELTGAYAVFANEGKRVSPTTILEIRNKFDKRIYAYEPQGQHVIGEDVAFLISSILSDNNARSPVFGNTLTISRPAAVKTGTTQSYRDSWTIGYTPSIAIGVWVGNNDGRSMDQVAGSMGALPIWRDLMEHFLEGTTVENFQVPGGVVAMIVCRSNGLTFSGVQTANVEGTEGETLVPPEFFYREYFLAGTEPKGRCTLPPPPEIAREQPEFVTEETPIVEVGRGGI